MGAKQRREAIMTSFKKISSKSVNTIKHHLEDLMTDQEIELAEQVTLKNKAESIEKLQQSLFRRTSFL